MTRPHYNILIVDDSPHDRATCKRYLQRDPDRNYTLWEEDLSRKGLVAAQVVKPDCILLDYRFPDIDGLQFLSQLQVLLGQRMPAVVMLTGSDREGVAIEAMKRGAQDYLVKDNLTQEGLWRAVRNAIEKVGLRHTLEAQHRQLRESEARFRALINSVPAMVWAAAPDGTMNLVTDQWLTYCGMTKEQLTCDWPRLVLHPDDYERCMTQWAQALANGTPYEIEVRNRRHDGEYRWFLTRAVPARDDSGRIIGWYGTTTNIHDRKQTEEALRQQAEIIDQTHDAVIAADLDGRITSWNKGAERLFGYEATEIIGCSVLVLLPEELQAQFPTLVMEPLRERGLHELEIRQRRKSGQECDVHLSLSLRRDQQGSVTGIIGYAIDITARKHAEEMQAKLLAEVQHVNEELQQFAYIVSHDLNEPLRAITNFITLLAKRYQGKFDAEADEYITFVTDGAHRMQQMLTALLAYTRVGRDETATTSVDCGTLLTQVLDDLRLAITDSQAVITYDPLPTIQGDATRLKQVLQNLISNAIKFRGQAPPQVHIAARRTDAQWQFSVRDNGIGFDPDQAGRLFQVFQRLHPHGGYQGTGIGLAICKRIVEQYGGRIWVESEPGKGTSFFFTLPATVPMNSQGNAIPEKAGLQEA